MAGKNKELYQRAGSAYWWYRFTNPRTQIQERGSTKTSNKQEAQRFLDALKADAWVEVVDVIEEASSKKEPKLWIEATTKWLEVKDSKRSIETDIQRLNVIADSLDEIPIHLIDDDLIHERIVVGICKRRKHKPATINRYLDLIRSILKACERWRWIDRAPMLERPGKAGERRRKAWLTPEQFHRAQKAMSPLKAKLMTLSLCTGMRINNLLSLHPSEVDIDNKRIFIPAAKHKSGYDHTVPLNRTAIKILEAELGKYENAVFARFGDKPMTKINLRDWHQVFDRLGINEELRSAGLLPREKDKEGEYLERFVFHGMRHTFATWLARSGVPFEIIRAIGGWADSGSKNKMLDIYTHIDDVTHLLPFVRRIDQILEGKKKI